MQRAEDILALDAEEQRRRDERRAVLEAQWDDARQEAQARGAINPETDRYDLESEKDQMRNWKMEEAQDRWAAAPDWQSLLTLNREFIRGESYCTPYHAAPLHIDSKALANKLLRLHDYGFLTCNGQGFEDANTYVAEVGKWVWTQQRPYLCFIAPRGSTNDKFCETLLRHPAVYCSIFNSHMGTLSSNLMRRWTVSRAKVGRSEAEAANNPEWLDETSSGPLMEDGSIHISPERGPTVDASWGGLEGFLFDEEQYPASVRIKPLQINVAFRGPWGQPFEMEEFIYSEAKKAGMLPMYAEH